MWTPTWRAPVTIQTWAPRRERRRPIFMWLFTSIRGVASLPVRVSVVMVRAMRSMCLYLRQSWSALSWSARYDRSLPASNRYGRSLPASKASLPPSPAQQRVRDARLQTLIRLDKESLVSSLTKTLLDPIRLVADPTHLTSAIERNIDHRAPLLNWGLKHHSPAVVYDGLTTSGSMLEALGVRLLQTLRQIPSPDQVEARLAEQRRKLAARKAGPRIVETTARPAVSKRPALGKGVELKRALMPIITAESKRLIEAAWRNPTRAPAILLPGVRTLATWGTWRLSGLTGVGDRRGIMDSVLCQAAYTVSVVRAQLDPDECPEDSECRAVLDGGCLVPEESDESR